MSTLADASPPPRRRLWLALVCAPLAWALQGLLGWYVSGSACADRDASWGSLGGGGVRAVEIGISAIALAIALACFLTGLRAFQASADRAVTAIHARARADFLAAAALLISAVFALGIVWAALPSFILPVCERMR